MAMDFPPMDWGAFFAFNPAILEPPLSDNTRGAATGDGNGLGGSSGMPPLSDLQLKDAETTSKLGVCSSCRKKKRRCNLERPSCSLCRINGWVCEYRHVKKKPGPPRNSFVRRSTRDSKPERVENFAAPPSDTAESTITVNNPEVIESNHWVSHVPTNTFIDRPISEPIDIASSLSTGPQDDSNSVVSVQALSLSEDSKSILISLYFENVQPIFPLFRRPAFEADLADNKIPEALLCMMFALASRYVPGSELSRVFGPNMTEPWEYFSRASFRKSRFCDENDSDAPMSLEDIKTSFLLALHEYTSFPGRKAWMRVSNTVRVAIAAGLNRVDQPGRQNVVSMLDAELEEWRLTWWAVWRVDSSINVLAGTPYNIETADVFTALPSSSTAMFTAGIIPSSSRDFLPSDVIRPWNSAQDLERIVSKDTAEFYYQTVSYNREAAICRRRLYSNPTPELMGEFNKLKQVLPYMRVALSNLFFSGVKLSTEENSDRHRKRIETLILVHITEIVLYLPIKEHDFDNANPRLQNRLIADWQLCMDNVEEIAGLLRHWEPQYSRLTDPLISCVIWLSCTLLVLHTMSASYQQSKRPGQRDSIQESLETLTTALDGFSRYWPIASLLSKSLQNLRSWNWLSLDFHDVLRVASQLQAPIDPQAQNPATINVWPVFANPSDRLFDDHMMLK